jgi:2-oxoisovalerate dehydrogenase E1 component
MSVGPTDVVRANFDRLLARSDNRATSSMRPSGRLRPDSALTVERAVALFIDQMRARELDAAARRLRARGRTVQAVPGAGHELNAVVGALLRTTDPALLHYRSGAFVMARARQAPDADPIGDAVLSLVGAADEPASGGRRWTWGAPDLWVIPQTGVAAAQVPKATGLAVGHDLASQLGVPAGLPDDSVVCCSFGDAAASHATALAGIHAARYASRLGYGVPVLFVCEDDGLGMATPTPRGWVAGSYRGLPNLEYVQATGEVDQVWHQVEAAVDHCRTSRVPVFVHLPTVRLRDGASTVTGEVSPDGGTEVEARDPVLLTARRLIALGAADTDMLHDVVQAVRHEIDEAVERFADHPPLQSQGAVTAVTAGFHRQAVVDDAAVVAAPQRRVSHFVRALPEDATAPTARTLGAQMTAALHDELLRRPELVVLGTSATDDRGGLRDAFGARRVVDTVPDETATLGLAQGMGLRGLVPLVQVRSLGHLLAAADQLRAEACATGFVSGGRFRTPMVVRAAAFARGRGPAAVHDDHAVAALRDVPGLVVGAPSRGADAVGMLRAATAMAAVDGRVVCMLDPAALADEQDLLVHGDGRWLTDYPPPGTCLLPGDVGVYGAAHTDVLIVTFGAGVRLALRAARRLVAEHGALARIVDLRWLAPLPVAAVVEHARQCRAVLVADECRASGGVADAVVAHLVDEQVAGAIATARSADSYVPQGASADLVVLSEQQVFDAAVGLLTRS